jgi:hypothetical protein
VKFFKAPEANREIERLTAENEALKAQLQGRAAPAIKPTAEPRSPAAVETPNAGEVSRLTSENARLNAENLRLQQSGAAPKKTADELWAEYATIEDLRERRKFYLKHQDVLDD